MSEPQLMGYKPTQNEGLHREGLANGGIKTGKVSPGQVLGIELHQNVLNHRGEKETNGVVVDMKSEEVVIKSGKNGDTSSSSDDDQDKKKKEQQPLVGVFEVFRFADKLDVLLMIFGMLFACCHGAALPGMIIVFGDMIDLFVNHGKSMAMLPNATSSPDSLQNDLVGTMSKYAIYYVIIGGGVIIVGYCQVAFWMLASERQSFRIRLRFFRNIMRQEIGWFDTHESGELNTRLADDVGKIHDGIGDKLGSFFQWLSGGIAGFTIGFVFGWKLTLVILAISPVLGACAFTMTKLVSSMSGKELKAYAKAGAVAEEVLGAIRTVTAFGGQEKECKRYNANLIEARDFGVKKGFINGVAVGIVWLVIFCAYALGFWYGAKLIREENYSIGNVMIVFFSVLIGAFSLGHAAPDVQSFSVARGAAYVVYKLIDQNPDIDSDSDSGMKPNSVAGTIEFKNVHFNYPSRPDVKVLNGVNLKVNRGETVALVGSSGCGKSTTVQLIQRFYDVGEGAILLDGVDVRQLNVKWLRQNIGIVSQEPVLFGTTIAENISYGREGVTQKEIEEAAIMANAHSFIKDLPDKYNTLVGERGAQLSGGQKQRIAIARALVRDPKILLLDEATSALDTESESVVQEALERASHGRTTIIIAHRLSTIKNADKIAGFKDGVVKEIGTHDELMQHKGIYCQLVTLQTQQQDEEDLEIENLVKDDGAIQNKLLRQMSSIVESPLKHQISEKGELKGDKKEDEKAPQISVTRILRMNAPEWYLILLGCFGSLINGGVMPAFAIIFSEILGVFVKPHDEQERQIAIYCGIFIAIGGTSFIAYFVQGYTFGRSGEHLTMRLRELSFRAMLRQEIAWFDDHKNNTGALTTRLATDASQVQGASGIRLGTMIQSVASILTGVIIAFVYGWKMSLVLLGFLPFIAIAGALQMKILSGVAGKNKEALEGAGKVAVEGVENIRTVASLTKEEMFYQNYKSTLTEPYEAALKKAHVVGITFSISQAIIFFAYATAFWFGAWLINRGEMQYVDVFKVFSAIVFGAMAIGQASSFAPDAGKASASAGHIFALLDKVPAIDVQSQDGLKLTEGQFTSKVVFKDVKFRYPNRPDVTVLNGLDLCVNPGETVALVGSSGCGKSTTVQLTERFYDVEDGVLSLDKYNVKDLNLHWLRSQIGVVSQEPVLFGTSIAENIAYGDNSRTVTMDEIIAAARKANIHTFIESLPLGYDTNVGDKGAQLSGGQKQRVAIARALLRNPKILLLDEATSALDTESEKIVQEALDRAQEGRTCIVIAHRLSTIQNADKICVIRHGQVVEQGTHSELLAKQGFYYKLNMAQQRKRL